MDTKVMRGLGLVLVLSLGIYAATTVAAERMAPSETKPTADMYINLNAPSAAGDQTDPNNLWVSLSGDPAGNCVTTRVTYLKFNLAPGPVDPELKLILTRSGATGNATGYTVGLYQVTNSWSENDQWNTAPLPGTRIGVLQSFPATNGAHVVFSGTALVNYVQSHANSDHVVSFVIQLVSPGVCPAGVVSAVFDSSEDAGGSAPVLTVQSPPEPTSSPTPSATLSPTPGNTPNVTPSPAPGITPNVTPNVTPSATPSPTPETPGPKQYYLRLPLILRR